jgi:quinol monooxygenase YgiN
VENQDFGQRQYEPAAQPPKSNLERLIENFIENQTVTNQKNDDKFEEINQKLKNLENQIAGCTQYTWIWMQEKIQKWIFTY